MIDSSLDPMCSVEACNADDDDCDGEVDEDFVLDSDLDHCGACGNACAFEPGQTGTNACVGGSCIVQVCPDSLRNCDLEDSNGCESDLRELENCGECGVGCELFMAEAACTTGTCTVDACLPDHADCDDRSENGCEALLTSDLFHCGDCGEGCARNPTRAAATCREGECGVDCDPGFEDCNGDIIDGCETVLSLTTSCGGCGVRCPSGQLCSGDARRGFVCIPPPCTGSLTLCTESCVDTNADTLHCGGCDIACDVVTNARASCVAGTCGFICDPSFANCDGDPANGCETNIASDTANCGACGASCPSGVCVGAVCSGDVTLPNRVFVAVPGVSVTALGVAGADLVCNQHASAAGLAGSYVAWLSTSTVAARDRLGAARGWLRIDGLPFADTLADIVAGRIMHPVLLDASGVRVPLGTALAVATGTLDEGTAVSSATCNDYTNPAAQVAAGRANGTTGLFSHASSNRSCDDEAVAIYCFGVDNVHALAVTPRTGPLAFLAPPWLPGGGLAAADAHCTDVAAAAGVAGEFVAFLSTSSEPASARPTPGHIYVRPDGFEVGTPVQAPINAMLDGSYVEARPWTGAYDENCADWTTSSDAVRGGVGEASSIQYWNAQTILSCDVPRPVYCFQR